MLEIRKGFRGSETFFALINEGGEVIGSFPSVSKALAEMPPEGKLEVMRCTECGQLSLPCEWEERSPTCPRCQTVSGGRGFYKIPRSIVSARVLQEGAPPRAVEVTFGREVYRVSVYRGGAPIAFFQGWQGSTGASPTIRRFAEEDRQYVLGELRGLEGRLSGPKRDAVTNVIRALEGGVNA